MGKDEAMAKRDFYEVQGVSRDADDKTIKAAYRKLAMANHPDQNLMMKRRLNGFVKPAKLTVLKDGQKRAAYDQLGHAAFEQSAGFGGGGGGAGAGFGGFGGGFSDIFEQMFSEFSGGPGGGGQSRHGADLRYDLDIDLDEAFTGCTKDIVAEISASCEECSGTGAAKGSRPATCSGCGGRGKVRAQQGFFTVERTCPSCQGVGEDNS